MLNVLYYLIIRPLELVFEIIFALAYKRLENVALSVVVLSIIVNFVVLPLYRYADIQQEKQRQIEKELQRGVKHIKKVFRGDERFLMLQNYYRENNYKPIYQIKSILPLLMQIPFFIAAYRFLSGQSLLENGSIGMIGNLGKPDQLLELSGIKVNILPLIMTVINIVAGLIYSKGHAAKEKVQLFVAAVVFLILLYDSPAGLVFYWTLNNVFSLFKNIILHISNKKEKLSVEKKYINVEDVKLFTISCAIFALLAGFLIPSIVIGSSPVEFIDIESPQNPVTYILKTVLMSIGGWGFIVLLFKASVKNTKFASGTMFAFSISASAICMIFGGKKGTLTSYLQYHEGLNYSPKEVGGSIVVFLLVVVVSIILIKAGITKSISIILLIVVIISGTINIVKIEKAYKDWGYIHEHNSNEGNIKLSSEGKNIIVLMMDRAIATELPYIFNEKKELVEKFDGFTFYPNTVSFGISTVFGAPSVYGGYEYTPDAINKRKDESLLSKHNESLKVLPVLFDENNYEVTVVNPPYAGYKTEPDLSVFDDYPDINAFNTGESFMNYYGVGNESNDKLKIRNLMMYGIMRTLPCLLQYGIYDEGNYLSLDEGRGYTYQYLDGIHKADGMSLFFMREYAVINNLNKLTEISNEKKDFFLIMTNQTTHEPVLLQTPDYVPQFIVDNSQYDLEREKYQNINGRYLKLQDELQITHYNANMVSYIKLGEWFDWLRQQGVYDNSRIIIVSDHGKDVKHFNDLLLEDGTDVEYFNPVLMVKDFNSHGFDISDEFMTNADVPALATENIIEKPVNPFTGKMIDSGEKYAHDQHILNSIEGWKVIEYKLNTFPSGKWYYVHDNVYDIKNWEYDGEY